MMLPLGNGLCLAAMRLTWHFKLGMAFHCKPDNMFIIFGTGDRFSQFTRSMLHLMALLIVRHALVHSSHQRPVLVLKNCTFDYAHCIRLDSAIIISDWLIGDNFLRSVYSVYDFGDFDSEGKMGNPYMKLLPIIDADEASVDFHKIRGGQPKTNITYKGLDGISVMPSFNISEDISESLEKIGRYLPAMLAVVALNALILIALVVVGVVICYRKRNPAVPARTTRGRLSPMPLSDRNTYIPGSGTGHGYQPVYSMAISENDSVFVAPSPAFHNYDGNTLRPGDRPKSVA